MLFHWLKIIKNNSWWRLFLATFIFFSVSAKTLCWKGPREYSSFKDETLFSLVTNNPHSNSIGCLIPTNKKLVLYLLTISQMLCCFYFITANSNLEKLCLKRSKLMIFYSEELPLKNRGQLCLEISVVINPSKILSIQKRNTSRVVEEMPL